MAYTKKITYSKEFLTGTLAGLSVRCEFKTTSDAVHIHLGELQKVTKLAPGKDYGSGSTYWVYNLGCEDIAPSCDCQPVQVAGESIHDLTCGLFDGLPIAARRSKRTATCGHCRSQYDPTMGSCGCYDGDCQ